MALREAEVRPWLERVAPDQPLSKVAKAADLPVMRFRQQLARDSVAEASVVSVCRGLGLDARAALASFSTYSDLTAAAPASKEVPAFLGTGIMLDALKWRLGFGHPPEEPSIEEDLKLTARRWFESVLEPETRSEIQASLGLSQSGLWKIVRNGLRADVVAVAAKRTGISPAGGLVAIGLLTPTEAGWPRHALGDWIAKVPRAELLQVVQSRLLEIGDQLHKDAAAQKYLG